MGTLKGFPHPPATSSGGRSPPPLTRSMTFPSIGGMARGLGTGGGFRCGLVGNGRGACGYAFRVSAEKEQSFVRGEKGDVPDDPVSRMRHSASHVMADAVRRLRPRRQGGDRSVDRDGVLLRLRHRAVRARGRGADRSGDAEDHRRERCRSSGTSSRAPRRSSGSVRVARSTRSRSSNRSPKGKRSRTSSTATSSTSAAARTSSGPATSRPSRCSRSPAPTGAATSGTRSSSASTARRSRRRRSWTSTCTGSRRRRSATTARWDASWICSRSTSWSVRASRSGTPRGRSSAQILEDLHPARGAPARLPAGLQRPTSRARSCSRPRATSRTTTRTCSAGWSWKGSATSSSR